MLTVYISMLDSPEDKDLFEKMYIENRQDMYAVAYSVLKKKEDAEDAVHQSFLKIADNFTKISQMPCNELKAYIVIISRNTAINMYNSNKRRAERTAELTDDLSDPDYEYLSEDYSRLIAAIRQLPQIYKDVLFLYYLQGFSAKQTAVQLGLTANAVRQRALRARQMLREIIEKGRDIHD